ncbi:MAG: hypothetical protein U1A25_03410 [Candidatus Sungbacteria bacterium]|nr:hypothetical protein [bacterium]MDZ4260692.1 hypothetical protein [Candidatus Sungbacteria bacterium]
MSEVLIEQKEYSPENARNKLWTFMESEREATRVLSPKSSLEHFLFTPGFPLPGSIVKEDLVRIPNDEVIIFSKAYDGTLTREEFDAYNKKFPGEEENDIMNIDPLRYALLLFVRSRMTVPDMIRSEGT